MRKLLALLLSIVSLLLCGCWDRTEIDDHAFAMTLAVDKAGRGEYLWTFRFAQAEQLPVGMLPIGPGAPQFRAAGLVSVRGRNLEQAIQLAQSGSARIVSLEQLRMLLIGEDVAREGVASLMEQLLRHNEVRRGAGMALCRGRAADVLRLNRPIEAENSLKFSEGILLVAKKVHQFPYTRMQHFYGHFLSPGVDPILMLAAINPVAGRPPGADLPPMGEESRIAGEFPKAGGNPLELAGTAVFRRDRLAGFLTIDETTALMALRGEMGKVYATVPDPEKAGEQVALRFHQENKPKYRVRIVQGRPVADVHLQLEGEILSVTGRSSYTGVADRRQLEQFIAGHLRRTVYLPLVRKLYREWGADPVGIGDLLRTQFPTFDAWMDYRWENQVWNVQADVTVDLYIRRFGMVLDRPMRNGG